MNLALDLDKTDNPSEANKIVELEDMLTNLGQEDDAWDESDFDEEEEQPRDGMRDISDEDTAVFEFDDEEEFEIDGLVFRVEKHADEIMLDFGSAEETDAVEVLDLSAFLIDDEHEEAKAEKPDKVEPTIIETLVDGSAKSKPAVQKAAPKMPARPATAQKELAKSPKKAVPTTPPPQAARQPVARQPQTTSSRAPAPPPPRPAARRTAAAPAKPPILPQEEETLDLAEFADSPEAIGARGSKRGHYARVTLLTLLLVILILILLSYI